MCATLELYHVKGDGRLDAIIALDSSMEARRLRHEVDSILGLQRIQVQAQVMTLSILDVVLVNLAAHFKLASIVFIIRWSCQRQLDAFELLGSRWYGYFDRQPRQFVHSGRG